MHALSVKQPFAELIASGEKRREYRTWAPRAIVGCDLVIVASRTRVHDGAEDLPVGVAVCVVHVTRIDETVDGYAWVLARPRRVEPTPIVGRAALFQVADSAIVYSSSAPSSAPRRRERSTSASSSAPRRHARAPSPRLRRIAGKYSLSIDDRTIVSGLPDMATARVRAAELARERGCVVDIESDGFAVSYAEPPKRDEPIGDPREPFTFELDRGDGGGFERVDGSEASEHDARKTALFISALYFGARVRILFRGRVIGEPIMVEAS